MAVTKKTLFAENLDRYQTFVTDNNPTSEYFKITELSDTFTGGKNAFLIQGSDYLVPDTLIKIEIKDSKGNIIYHEPGEGIVSSSVDGAEVVTEYYEGVSKVVAVHIYPDTTYGPATITILGELSSYNSNGLNSPIPLEWEGKYNVKWQRQINVNPSLANTTKIRFYRRPVAAIVETLSPIYTIVSGSKVESNIVSSFANITLSKLDTFAGDVKRIKVYRTSEGDISDYDMIQDILLESKELLTSYNLTGSVIGEAGLMTSEVLEKLWSYPTLTAELTSSRIDNGVKLNGSGLFRYTSSLHLSANSVYEFGIDTFYSASTNSDMGIYVSGSSNGEVLVGTLNGVTPTKNLKDTILQFTLPLDEPTASLYLSQSQSEWHIGNLSLKLTEDTAFSPSEISFVTSMPTVVGNETYNFKFEFYDVNNNYVPVLVTESALFTGGNNNIGGTLIFISASASSSLAQLNAVSSSISGTMIDYSSSADTTIITLSGSVSGSILTLSGSVSGSITSLSGSVSGSITSLSGSVSSSITSLSGSVSRSVALTLSASLSNVKLLADGGYAGTFIESSSIYSPNIAGQQGYISQKFQVGNTTPIVLDARTSTRKIYIGGVNDTGSYNSGSTSVYMDSTGKFSLKDKLTWDGTTLGIIGNLNVGSSVPNSVVTGLKALALKDTVSATEIDTGAVTNAKIAADAVTEGKLAVNAVTEGKISANAIVADKIAANAIVADKIATGAITAGKISAGAITAEKIEAGAITAGKIAAGAITAEKIEAGAITTAKLAAGAITADKVDVAGVITAGNIVIGGEGVNRLTNNAGYQNNAADKTAGSVGGWSINSSTISSNNGQTVFYNTGNISLTDGTTERIKITKDNLTTSVIATSANTNATGNNQNLSSANGTTWNYTNSRTIDYTTPVGVSAAFSISQNSLTLAVGYNGSAVGQTTGQVGIGTAFTSGITSLTGYQYSTYTFVAQMTITLEANNGGWSTVSSQTKEIYRETFTGNSAGAVSTGYSSGITAAAFGNLNTGLQHRVGISLKWEIKNAAIAFTTGTVPQWFLYTNQYSIPSQSFSINGYQLATKLEIGLNGIQISSAGGLTAIGSTAGAGLAGTFTGDVKVQGQISAAAFVASSDERLKTDIKEIESPMVKLSQLNPKSFLWNDASAPLTDKGYSYGFIAQEVQNYFPELVKIVKDSSTIENLLTLEYNAIIALNTAAIKQLVSKIEVLEDRILELEEKI